MRDGLSPTPPHQLAGMRIEPDSRPHDAIDLVAGRDRGLRQFLGAHLLLGHELGEAERVIAGIFGDFHDFLPSAGSCWTPTSTATACRVFPWDTRAERRTSPTSIPSPASKV